MDRNGTVLRKRAPTLSSLPVEELRPRELASDRNAIITIQLVVKSFKYMLKCKRNSEKRKSLQTLQLGDGERGSDIGENHKGELLPYADRDLLFVPTP